VEFKHGKRLEVSVSRVGDNLKGISVAAVPYTHGIFFGNCFEFISISTKCNKLEQ
jgi:hypothetical protein